MQNMTLATGDRVRATDGTVTFDGTVTLAAPRVVNVLADGESEAWPLYLIRWKVEPLPDEGGWTLIECERCGERMERDDPVAKGS